MRRLITAPIRKAWLLAALALPAACTCREAPPPAAAAAVAPSAPNDGAREGTVAVEFLADPAAPKPKLDADQEFTPASPLSTRLPEYPTAALAGGSPSADVGVGQVRKPGRGLRDV